MIEANHPCISLNHQCQLLGISKSSLYYEPVPKSSCNLEIMDWIDRQYLKTPCYGSRRMTACLRREGFEVNRKRVYRLMRLMGIEAIYPKTNLSRGRREHRKYPYLLKGVEILGPNHVWSTDITYIRIGQGFLYLMAVIDWFSRYIISWRLSNTLEGVFCRDGLLDALKDSKPVIFNTDQGSQFTSDIFLEPLLKNKIKISMDSKGRALDNVFIERFWRTLKYEEVYLKDYPNVKKANSSIGGFIFSYNNLRPHQSLGYKTPREVYFKKKYITY